MTLINTLCSQHFEKRAIAPCKTTSEYFLYLFEPWDYPRTKADAWTPMYLYSISDGCLCSYFTLTPIINIGGILGIDDANNSNNTKHDPTPITVANASATVPDAPTLTSVDPGDGKATLNFTANGNGGSAITGYTATCDSFSSPVPVSGPQNGATYLVTVFGLQNGVTYLCSVVATNAIGDSVPSAAISVTPVSFQMNAGLNDAWYYKPTDGQGFFITVFPDLGYVSLAWFTYDTELPPVDATANLGDPGHRWITALGPIDGNQVVMNITLTSGGIFDTPGEIDRTDPPGSDGTITLTFDHCNSGTIEYDIPSISRQGVIPIERVATDNVVLCETLSAGGDSSVLEIEPNDEKESATVFQLGNTVAGNLSEVTDIDWFAVEISSEQTGMVAVNFDVSSMESGSWSVDLYDPDMSIMSGRNLSAPEGLQYEFPAFTAGTYYLRVMINLDFLYSAGTYEVTLTEAP